MRGWFGERYAHKMASKGIRSKIRAMGEQRTHPYFEIDRHDIPNVLEFMTNRNYWNEKRDMDYKIVWMPVEEYEKAIEKGFNMERIYSGREKFDNKIRDRLTERHLEEIKDLLRNKKVPMPHISYWVHDKFKDPSFDKIIFGQEGHHRAVASEELGEPIIPVFIMYPINKWEDYGRGYMTDYIKEELYG